MRVLQEAKHVVEDVLEVVEGCEAVPDQVLVQVDEYENIDWSRALLGACLLSSTRCMCCIMYMLTV